MARELKPRLPIILVVIILLWISRRFGFEASTPLLLIAFERAFGLGISAPRQTVLWGTACGLLLYPSALGLGSYDLYSLGWSIYFQGAVALLTILLIVQKNPFGQTLLWTMGLYTLFGADSNLWQDLVDPIYFLGSLIALPFVFSGRTPKEAELD